MEGLPISAVVVSAASKSIIFLFFNLASLKKKGVNNRTRIFSQGLLVYYIDGIGNFFLI